MGEEKKVAGKGDWRRREAERPTRGGDQAGEKRGDAVHSSGWDFGARGCFGSGGRSPSPHAPAKKRKKSCPELPVDARLWCSELMAGMGQDGVFSFVYISRQ